MAHPAEAALQAIIDEEQANILAMEAQYQALMDAHVPGSGKRDMEFLMEVSDCRYGARNSQMVIRMIEVQIAILPQIP